MTILGIEPKLLRLTTAQFNANKFKAMELNLQLEIAKAEGLISDEQYEKLGGAINEDMRNAFSI